MALTQRTASACRVLLCLAIATGARAAPPVALQADGSLQIAGRSLKCGSVRNALDAHLPNLGISVPASKLLVINPALLARQSTTVRLFVFHHECGHHHVGASELNADCWAVHRGVQDGWLDRSGLGEVCNSFGHAPATATHPSGARRCANLDRCFNLAQAERTAAMSARAAVPQLVSGPRLIRDGMLR